MIEELQQSIRNYLTTNTSNEHLASDFDLYSASVVQKLWSAQYYLNRLQEIDIRTYWETSTISYTETTEAYSIDTQDQGLKIKRYGRDVHLLLDGFFFQSMSALDTLAHEIWTIFNFQGQQKPKRLYIGTIRTKLEQYHPSSELGKLLVSKLQQEWFSKFHQFRSCTTHESLIVYDSVKFDYDPITGEVKGYIVTLPDDPKIRPFTYNKKREAIKYCTTINIQIGSLISKSHEMILRDLRRCNYVFPISRP